MSNTTFVIKDQDNNFVSDGSITLDEEKSRVIYSYSKFLSNGFFSNPQWLGAKVHLDRLQALEDRFKLGKTFHIEEIDRYATLLAESKTGELKVGLSSIQYKYTDYNDGKKYAWVIRDNQNNFVHKNSIKKIAKDMLAYITFKTFGPECRGYVDLIKAEVALDKLQSRGRDMGLDATFHLEYLNIGEAIKQHKTFKGNNMVIVTAEKKVA